MSELHSYKVTLSYKGTHYRGWQKHPDNPNTIQTYIEDVLNKISDYKGYNLMVAGRTDAGVHAQAQVLKVDLPIQISNEHLVMGMNSQLPLDIRVVKSELIDSGFNPNTDSKLKEYHYYFTGKLITHASFNDIIYHHPKTLNYALMQEACHAFIGTHNFKAFTAKLKGSSTREVHYCSIEKTSFSPFIDEVYYLKVQAQGFLTYMMRFMMGSLLQYSEGLISLEEINDSLKNGNDIQNRLKAPAHGLHLMKITYQ